MTLKEPKHAGYSMPNLYVSNGVLKFQYYELTGSDINNVLDAIERNDAIYLDGDVIGYMIDWSHNPELFDGKLLFDTEEDFNNYIYDDIITN